MDVTTLIIAFLLYWWSLQLIYKLTELNKPDNKFYNWAVNIKNKFIQWFFTELFQCQFCIESHIGFIYSIPISVYCSDLKLLVLGYAFAGLSDIIKKLQPE